MAWHLVKHWNNFTYLPYVVLFRWSVWARPVWYSSPARPTVCVCLALKMHLHQIRENGAIVCTWTVQFALP